MRYMHGRGSPATRGGMFMLIRSTAACAAALAAGLAIAGTLPAQALTAKECSAKYKAAQQAGTLNGMKWNDFRKAECGSGAAATPAAGGARAGRAPAAGGGGPPAPRAGADRREAASR